MPETKPEKPFEITKEELDHLPLFERLIALMEIKLGRWQLEGAT